MLFEPNLMIDKGDRGFFLDFSSVNPKNIRKRFIWEASASTRPLRFSSKVLAEA